MRQSPRLTPPARRSEDAPPHAALVEFVRALARYEAQREADAADAQHPDPTRRDLQPLLDGPSI